MSLFRTLLWALPMVLLFSCSVEPVDLSGKTCPCEGGWHCLEGTCVRGEAGGPTCGSMPGVYVIKNLAGGWRTENALQWTWSTADDVRGEDLLHNTIVIGTDGPAVEACACKLEVGEPCDETGDLRVVDDSMNPELAHDTLTNRTGVPVPSRQTVTDSLRADTIYSAVLLAFDTMGGVSRSSSVQHRTGRLTEGMLVAFDGGPAGSGTYTFPKAVCFEAAAGYSYDVLCPPPVEYRGTCRDGTSTCAPGATWPGASSDSWLCEPDEHPEHAGSCWLTFRWQALPLRPGNVISEGAFADAYLEFAATISDTPSNYGELYMSLRSADALTTEHWNYIADLALRGGARERVYQLPLSALTKDDHPMVWADLRVNDMEATISRLAIGGIFSHGDTVSVRYLRIRY